MAKEYLVRTGGGDKILTGLIPVVFDDGTYRLVSVGEAESLCGKVYTIIDPKFIDIDPDSLESQLMQLTEGKHADYKKANFRLKVEVDDILMPKLGFTLRKCHEQNPTLSKKEFLDDVYNYLLIGSRKLNFITVKRDSIDIWYDKGEHAVIAPADWRNFFGLSLLKEKYAEAKEFEKFYGDYVNYRRGINSNSVSGNLYYAYLFYRICQQDIGKGDRTLYTTPDSKPKSIIMSWLGFLAEQIGQVIDIFRRRPSNVILRRDLNEMKNGLGGCLFRKLNDNAYLVPLFSVKELSYENTPETKKTDPRKGIYTAEECKGLNIPEKSLSELCTDVAIIERILVNYVNSYIMRLPKINDLWKTYIIICLEEKVRHVEYEKRHLFLANNDRGKCEGIANQIYRDIFNGDKADNLFELQTGSFVKLKDVRDMLIQFYPKEVDEYFVIDSNRKRVAILAERTSNRKEKRPYLLELRKLDYKLERLKPFFEKNKDLIKKNMISEMLPKLGYNGALNAYEFKREDLFEKLGLPPTLDGELRLREMFFTQDEISGVLNKYGLGYMTNSNFEIGILNRVFPPK